MIMRTLSHSLFAACVCSCLLLVRTSVAQPLTWHDSKSNAMSSALSQGKLVLLMAGRHTCPNCNYMQGTVCETVSPPIKALIQSQFVPWFCAVDTSTEWYAYASGLGAWTLPMICCIDPANPDVYLDRTTAIQDTQVFYDRLLAQAGNQTATSRIGQCCISNGRISLTLTNLVIGKTNVIERSVDLKSWTSVGDRIGLHGGKVKQILGGIPSGLYRLFPSRWLPCLNVAGVRVAAV